MKKLFTFCCTGPQRRIGEMKPVANESLKNTGLIGTIMLRGTSSRRPPVGIGSIDVVRGQGDCHAQLAKINKTPHAYGHKHKCTIVHRRVCTCFECLLISNIHLGRHSGKAATSENCIHRKCSHVNLLRA